MTRMTERNFVGPSNRGPMRTRLSSLASLATIALALALAFAPTRSTWVEWLFSNGLYARLQPPLTRVSNVIPFALFDALIIFVAILLGVWFVAAWKRPKTHIWRFVLRVGTLAAGTLSGVSGHLGSELPARTTATHARVS